MGPLFAELWCLLPIASAIVCHCQCQPDKGQSGNVVCILVFTNIWGILKMSGKNNKNRCQIEVWHFSPLYWLTTARRSHVFWTGWNQKFRIVFKVFLTFSVNSYSVRCLKCSKASAKDFCHSSATQSCLYGSIYMVPVSATLISTKCVSWSRLKKERQSRFPPALTPTPTLTPTLTQLHKSSHHTTPHLHIPISHFYTTPLCVLIDWLAAVRFSMIFCLFSLQVNQWQASQSPQRCGKQSKMGWGLPNTMSVY